MAEELIEEVTEKELTTEKEPGFFKAVLPYAIILVAVILIRWFIITPVIVSGESMQPTFDGGEVVLLYKLAKYDRFDVVVVHIKTDKYDERIIKRVIALPGETVSCEGGVIYVNDRKIEEDYSIGTTPDFEKVTLEDDEYFVLGDNREHSLDSQDKDIGPLKKKEIQGRPIFTLWPFNKIGTIKK